MIAALIGAVMGMVPVSGMAAASSASSVRAELAMDADGAAMIVAVREGSRQAAPGNRRLAIDCVARCPQPLHYTEAVDDTPLGLFRLGDADAMIFSIWAGGSAYRVRVYEVRINGVRKLLDASTLGAPAFLAAADGAPIVRTTARDDRAPPGAPARIVDWTWRHDRFVRGKAR